VAGAIRCRGRYRNTGNVGGSLDRPCDDQGVGDGRASFAPSQPCVVGLVSIQSALHPYCDVESGIGRRLLRRATGQTQFRSLRRGGASPSERPGSERGPERVEEREPSRRRATVCSVLVVAALPSRPRVVPCRPTRTLRRCRQATTIRGY
jgi:hypothetical protein